MKTIESGECASFSTPNKNKHTTAAKSEVGDDFDFTSTKISMFGQLQVVDRYAHRVS